ncbi:hypothetical protein P0F65_10170 [Sphingomonas sp. I4]
MAFTALFFLVFALVFRQLEATVLAYARAPLLDMVVAWLGWPVVLLCMALGGIAFLHGLQGGFPLLAGVDRFLYRREYSSGLVLILLDNKFLFAAMLGAVAFAPRYQPLLKTAAIVAFLGLTGLYFLFGDKFFTILAEVAFSRCRCCSRGRDDWRGRCCGWRCRWARCCARHWPRRCISIRAMAACRSTER